MNNIFTYGTLMFPKLVYALTGKNFRSEDAHIENYIRYKVITSNSYEEYPAIIENSGSNVNGKLLYDIDDESLNIIDFYEGDEYKRITRPISLSDKAPIEAFVYVWNFKYPLVKQVGWHKAFFKNHHLKYYLNQVIPMLKDDFFKQ